MTESRAVEFKDLKFLFFNHEEYIEIKAGRKTLTRRLIHPQPNPDLFELGRIDFQSDERFINSPALYWQPIVKFNTQRQYFACPLAINDRVEVLHPTFYHDFMVADENNLQEIDIYDDVQKFLEKSPAAQHRLMNVEWDRIQIKITNIRAHRMHLTNYVDLKAEGIGTEFSYRNQYLSIYGPSVWRLNPWVWIYDFELVA